MDDLRLIMLAAGLLLLAFIYFWETGKSRRQQRKQQRRETVSLSSSESDTPSLHIKKDSEDPDISVAISELNATLAETRQQEDEFISDALSAVVEKSDKQELASPVFEEQHSGSGDLFEARRQIPVTPTEEPSFVDDFKDIAEEQVITLYVTSSPVKDFGGGEILDAVNEVGLEYGEMKIFHHFGIGDVPLDRPIFSLADMFEPGYFELDKIQSHQTRGLSLFMCLPLPIDGLIVFELMLNTAERLAEILGGEIRGSNHELLDDEHIAAIRKAISH